MAGDRGDRPAVATPHPRGVQPRLVAEDGRRAVDPAEGRPHVRPRGLGRLRSPRQDRPWPAQPLRQPLWAATRPRPVATSVSRPAGFSPEAASGGRPSSVNAERTARSRPDRPRIRHRHRPALRPGAGSAGCRGLPPSTGPRRDDRPHRPAWPPRGGEGGGRAGGARRRMPSRPPCGATSAVGGPRRRSAPAARLDLADQGREVALAGGQRAPGPQDLAAEGVAEHPEPLMADVGSRPVEGRDHPPGGSRDPPRPTGVPRRTGPAARRGGPAGGRRRGRRSARRGGPTRRESAGRCGARHGEGPPTGARTSRPNSCGGRTGLPSCPGRGGTPSAGCLGRGGGGPGRRVGRGRRGW